MQWIALLSKVHFKPFGLLSHSSRSSAATLLTLIHFQQRLFLSQAACPGHRTWVTPEVETGLAEGTRPLIRGGWTSAITNACEPTACIDRLYRGFRLLVDRPHSVNNVYDC